MNTKVHMIEFDKSLYFVFSEKFEEENDIKNPSIVSLHPMIFDVVTRNEETNDYIFKVKWIYTELKNGTNSDKEEFVKKRDCLLWLSNMEQLLIKEGYKNNNLWNQEKQNIMNEILSFRKDPNCNYSSRMHGDNDGEIDDETWKEYQERQFMNRCFRNVKVKIYDDEDDEGILLTDYYNKSVNANDIVSIWCTFKKNAISNGFENRDIEKMKNTRIQLDILFKKRETTSSSAYGIHFEIYDVKLC